MAAPDLRDRGPHTGRPTWSGWPSELARARATTGRGRRAPTTRDLQHRFDILGGYTLDQRVDEALVGLGVQPRRVAPSRRTAPVGRRPATRAALARLPRGRARPADARPAPTNPLDVAAIGCASRPHWRRRPGALIVASHEPGVSGRRGGARLGAARSGARRLYTASYSQRTSAQHEDRDARMRLEHGHRNISRADQRGAQLVQTYAQPPQVQQDARARAALLEAAPARSDVEAPRKSSRELAPATARAGRSRPGAVGRDRGPARRARRSGTCRAAGRWRPDGAGAPEPVIVATVAVPGRPARRADRHRGAERGRQDHAAPDDRRRPAAAGRGADVRARTSSLGYLAQLRDAAIPGDDGPRRPHRGDTR